jgi:hypothetical protein
MLNLRVNEGCRRSASARNRDALTSRCLPGAKCLQHGGDDRLSSSARACTPYTTCPRVSPPDAHQQSGAIYATIMATQADLMASHAGFSPRLARAAHIVLKNSRGTSRRGLL